MHTVDNCAGASVVYNCASPSYSKWVCEFPRIQAGILEGASIAGAKLVSVEDLYMYGEADGPLMEDLPYAATTRKGQVGAQMARDLLEAHDRGRVRVAIGRASDYYGPRGLTSFVGDWVFNQALESKKVTVFGNLDVPHT